MSTLVLDKAAENGSGVKTYDKPAYSDVLVESLRNEDLDTFSGTSVYAACLFPILEMFGKKEVNRELLESIPHFAQQLDLVDLRNILVSLGYESDPLDTRLDQLSVELYPALWESKSGDTWVLTERRGDSVSYFDANLRKYCVDNISNLRKAGRAYVFTDKNPTHGAKQSEASAGVWFDGLSARFRKMITHLLLMTFVINISALFVPIFIMMIYDKVIGAKSLDSLPFILSGVAILIVTDLVLRNKKAKAMGAVAGRLDYLIGVETFKQLLFLPPIFTERSTVSAQLSRLKQFDSLRDFFTGPSAAFVLEMPFILMFILAVAILAGPIAYIPLFMVVAYFVVGLLFRPPLERKVLRSGRARTDKETMLMQTFEGRREIKAIAGETVWKERFREVSGEAVRSNYDIFVANALMTNVSQALMTLSGIAVLAWGALMVMEGTMSIGALIATMTLSWRVLTPLQGMFLSYSKFQQMLKSVKQINNLMKLTVEKDESHIQLAKDGGRPDLKVDRVSFRYDAHRDPALLGVSFDVEPGEMVAVVGFTGSGKSTMLKLIAGMYKPQAGALLLDGVDLRQLNALDLRRSMAYVPQEIQMFHGTIAQNLRLNNCLATDEELEKAAEKAGVLDDIRRLPDGFNTRIGDKTLSKFPPGFTRALSIARAFCCNPQVVLLDEPGSSLDNDSDIRFMEQLKKMKGEHTVVMVSHRPSHIRIADKAVLLDQGSVQFVGAPDQAIEMILQAQ